MAASPGVREVPEEAVGSAHSRGTRPRRPSAAVLLILSSCRRKWEETNTAWPTLRGTPRPGSSHFPKSRLSAPAPLAAGCGRQASPAPGPTQPRVSRVPGFSRRSSQRVYLHAHGGSSHGRALGAPQRARCAPQSPSGERGSCRAQPSAPHTPPAARGLGTRPRQATGISSPGRPLPGAGRARRRSTRLTPHTVAALPRPQAKPRRPGPPPGPQVPGPRPRRDPAPQLARRRTGRVGKEGPFSAAASGRTGPAQRCGSALSFPGSDPRPLSQTGPARPVHVTTQAANPAGSGAALAAELYF
ncbi:translation initiation factor IF-2-like [Ictidomys tridecemlineatus]|uniref:translation initiation factor IF-2-like n=1 Tax=Ictidomys tridecemlineatus TaxID=43179 RepID=UPI000680567B|nr:translation initiation factor IF-2-like [Ictidomys tridecemlineatus]KAG3277521.1 translation initiation factor IF-2-like [Ictidomys tridecemlineatus]